MFGILFIKEFKEKERRLSTIVRDRMPMKEFIVVTCLAKVPGLIDKLNTALAEAARKASGRLVRIVTVDDYEQLETILPLPDYDYINVVLLHGVMDKENNVTMGASRFMTMMKNAPDKKYIYITPKKGRMVKLIENGYYDGLMVEDSFNIELLADILAGNRTEEKARKYFDVAKKNVDVTEEPEIDIKGTGVAEGTTDMESSELGELVQGDGNEDITSDAIEIVENIEENAVIASGTSAGVEEKLATAGEGGVDMGLSDLEDNSSVVYGMFAEEPMFQFANYSGYVTRITGADTFEVRLTYAPGQAAIDLKNQENAAYFLGSVVNVPVVVDSTINRKYSVDDE